MYDTMYIDSAMGMGEATLFAGLAAFFATYAIVIIAIAIACIVGLWLVYKKAGKPGWASIVPIYNSVVLFQIVGFNPWLLLLALIPFVGAFVIAILGIVAAFRLAKSFGKSGWFGLGLWLLAPIFYLILAFGSSEYVGPNGTRTEAKPE